MIFVLLIVPILYQTNFKIPIRIQGPGEKADRIRVLLFYFNSSSFNTWPNILADTEYLPGFMAWISGSPDTEFEFVLPDIKIISMIKFNDYFFTYSYFNLCYIEKI